MEAEIFVVWTTVGSETAAESLARELVKGGLAACVQVDGPVRSYYQWEGKLRCDEEWRIWLKCAGDRMEALEARARELHPYEQPQWVAVRADRVAAAYAAWVVGSREAGGPG